jgi:predicted nucleic acid-binding Zn finger protein
MTTIIALQVQGDSGTKYDIKTGKDGVVHCSCPAWRFQKVAPAKRTCKHINFVASKIG